jgi:hypothetical protein
VSTSLPPVPKKDSAGRRVAVIVGLAAALVVGFIAWKALQKAAPEPPPPPPEPAAVAPLAPVLEPPPPPPEEVPAPPPEEAKPEPAKPVGPRKDTFCEGECTGQETPELLSALRARAGQARSCYERALTHNSSLSGSVVLSLRVSPSGTACSASMAKDTLADPAVTNCVLQRFRSGKFPKPGGGCVDVALPINFVPAQR